MKHLLRSIALSLLWLSVGLACKNGTAITQQQPTGCSDGTCCGKSPAVIYEYDETLSGEPVMLGGPPYGTWGLGFGRPVPKVSVTPVRNRVATICDLTISKVEGLPFSPPPPAHNDLTFRPEYKVWGRIYTGVNIPTLIRGPIRFVYIERIERIN